MLTVEPVAGPKGQSTPGVTIVGLRGSADIHSTDQLQQALDALAAQKPKAFVLDLSGVDILTSLAIGVLVGFRKSVMDAGGTVVLSGVPEPIAKTLRFTRVSELFVRYGTAAEASAALR